MTKPLLLTSFYGEVPAHIRATFGMDKQECPYEVVRQGEKIPDEWEQAIVLYAPNPFDTRLADSLEAQLEALNPLGHVFVLPVEVEATRKSYFEQAEEDRAIRVYRWP